MFGSHDWSPNLHIKAVQSYGLASDVAKHLSENFGDRLHDVVNQRHFCVSLVICFVCQVKLCKPTGKHWPVLGVLVSPDFPFTEAEVRFVIRNEYACTLTDVLARRLRLGFLDTTGVFLFCAVCCFLF